MYLNRIQLINNGSIQRLDVSLPFNGDKPRPIVLVGENGTGKSILLSHIVNALVAAQCVAFPEAPEVDEGKVYKLRSPSYIRAESECYHSPLLVLGLQNSLGKEGLALYRMPEGNQIDAEEFEEFGNAYNVFKGTARTTPTFGWRFRARRSQSFSWMGGQIFCIFRGLPNS